jgi:hypothetical protein
MKSFKWNGGAVNLGRFGLVNKGDVLVLTDHEAEYVAREKDKNFQPVDPAKVKAPALPEDPKAAAAEKARREALDKANDTQVLADQEIREMKREELFVKAQALGLQLPEGIATPVLLERVMLAVKEAKRI